VGSTLLPGRRSGGGGPTRASGTICASAAGLYRTGARPGAGARAGDSAQISQAFPMLAVACSGSGKGTRMKSDRPKVLQSWPGVSLLERVSRLLREACADRRLLSWPSGRTRVEASPGLDTPASNFVRKPAQKRHGPRRPATARTHSAFQWRTACAQCDVPLLRPSPRSLLEQHRQQTGPPSPCSRLPRRPHGYGPVFQRRRWAAQRDRRTIATGHESNANQ